MSFPRVLVVDDERDFVRFIQEVLTKEQFNVSVAPTGAEALKKAEDTRPDLVLLDWNLPDIDGPRVCQTLKSSPATRDIPVVMLTVRRRETDVVVGLEIGADDFVSKRGLRPRELVARVRAALRKNGPRPESGEILRSGPLTFDTARRLVTLKETPLSLRPREFDLLYVFLKNEGRVLSRSFLEETIWGTDYEGSSRAVDSTVARLRSKLGSAASFVTAIQGVGYQWKSD